MKIYLVFRGLVGLVTSNHSRLLLMLILLNLCLSDLSEARDRAFAEKQRYDGWYNNLAHPNWGSAESQLTRKAPASYSDGVYTMTGDQRPSPRTIS